MRKRAHERRAEHLGDMAWECRRLAAVVSDAAVRLDLLSLAARFERLAEESRGDAGWSAAGTAARSRGSF